MSYSPFNQPTESYAWPWIIMEPGKIVSLTEALIHANVQYGFGAKAVPLSKQPGTFRAIDCSGFVRWAIYHAANTTIPDGSVQQHEWAKVQRLKESDFESGKLDDGGIRIAFLTPSASKDGIGHVVLITGGKTCESHGGKGPDRRLWGSRPYHRLMALYVVTPP